MDTREKIIIAIDGHSSCGKSTYAKRIAREIEYTYIDTGAMYRAVTLACLKEGLFRHTGEPSTERIAEVLEGISLDLVYHRERERTEIHLNGEVVEDRIREMDVAEHVSFIASVSAVRRKMVEYQRELGKEKGVVMDGRDIGTVVFPRAEMKIFLTASLDVRAGRRYRELLEKGIQADLQQVKENLEKRDHIDSTRADSPLKKAEDALVLDNSRMTVDEQMDWFYERYGQLIAGRHGQH